MIFKKCFFLFSTVFLISSCATYAPQYKDKEAKAVFPSHKKIEKSFYLVGDAGLSPMGGMSDALKTFNQYLKTEKSPGNYTLYLGDNIYPSGMDPEGHPRRKESENMIDAQYKAVKDYQGPTIFLPGNHEWYNNGVVGVAREENYVESLFPDQDAFRPSNGCPLESIAVSETIQLIVIDTQWYLEDWNKNPSINKNCDIKTREKFFLELQLALEKSQNKTVVFAMHHPMFTNGNHGGYFALEKHLYPLQKKIPMPVLASLVVQVRSQGGVSVQDRYNELYNNLMNRLQELVKNNKRLVFVSGHDHNMQYIEKDGLRQIVSGAGAKESYAAIGKDGLFSTGAQGFAVLDVFDDGSSWVRYFVKGENYTPKLLFQKEIIPAPVEPDLSQYREVFPQEYTVPIFKQDSINEALFFKTVWGAKYENAYSQPVTAKVASLDTLYGGLHVIQESKGADYNSLLLADKKGNRYRLRAMGKNALEVSRKIVFNDNKAEFSEEEKIDIPSIKGQSVNFYTASHPYAIMAIPDMARAIGIFYTTPQLFYVPKQKRLGRYNENFGDDLYLISIEPSEKSEGEGLFKYPDDVETTDDILIKLRQTGDVAVDEDNYIKSRLFDMLIGDWDREPGHWRWAEYYNRFQKNVYVPIPNNRDNAFSSFEGNVFDITRSLFNGSLEKHVYSENLTDLEWFNKEGVILDRAILKNSGRGQWKYLAKAIQDSLTDAVIEKAFNQVPPEVQDEALQDIKEKLKQRKAKLVEIADAYYSYFSTLQTIVGTDYDELFQITRLPDGKTQVQSFTVINGKKSDTLINRTYSHKDTRELWIYGLGGNDTFEVNNEADDLIFVRLIGGHGEDVYTLNAGRRVKVYDYQDAPTEITQKNGGSLRFTNVYNLNTYDYRKQIERSQGLLSAIGFNPDDGFRAAMQYAYRVDSYTRNPFSQKHQINAAYFTDINSFEISYSGEFANIKDDLNLSFGARFTSPNFTRNFFGFGNETTNPQKTKGYEYNRIEVQHISGNIGLLRNSNFGSFFKLQTTFDAYQVNNSPSNFIATVNLQNKGKTSYYGTLEGIYNYRSFDDPLNPTVGLMFDLNLGLTDNLEAMDNLFGYLKTRLGFYNSLIRNRTLVLKTNLKYEYNIGEKYQFYQAANLGGNNGLRGYREQRFTGKSFLVGSADLRYSLPKFKIGLIPFQVGIYGGADLGRVWLADVRSEKWHNSRGGGLWINGSGGLNANLSLFNSTEGSRLTFGLGFDF
ncbi:metallophosphoesterase [Aequorivita marisscotiae]|uniref:Metallophosphoesterase n=1 Tax=Aequorivita marisscotiae TaxID=3040348 RepID=A0ABY8KS02_9FLAO|nr:BamA/TamA family outer membrane protein [Aequorivita sp. Ant34-E75]WGF92234.1 metallophosphoesterase [Aequorivita sp. Ant34-E75]